MTHVIRILVILLALGAFPINSQSQDAGNEAIANIESQLDILDADVAAFRALSERIDTASETDRLQLQYRQDERIFNILMDYDSLASQVAVLPQGSTQRQEFVQHFVSTRRNILNEACALSEREENPEFEEMTINELSLIHI